MRDALPMLQRMAHISHLSTKRTSRGGVQVGVPCRHGGITESSWRTLEKATATIPAAHIVWYPLPAKNYTLLYVVTYPLSGMPDNTSPIGPRAVYLYSDVHHQVTSRFPSLWHSQKALLRSAPFEVLDIRDFSRLVSEALAKEAFDRCQEAACVTYESLCYLSIFLGELYRDPQQCRMVSSPPSPVSVPSSRPTHRLIS